MIGWNEVKFSEPYPIKAGEELYAGYTYTQLSDNTDTKSYPFSAVEDGLADQPLWVYCKLGNDTGWNGFSMNGYNISIQVLVEGDFAEYDVMPSDFGTVKGTINSNVETSVEFTNNAVEAVSSLDYVVSVDGVAGSEQHVAISPSVGYNKIGTFKVSIPCGSTEGLKSVKVEVTKVNGHKNGGTTTLAEGKLSVAANMYKRNLCIEELLQSSVATVREWQDSCTHILRRQILLACLLYATMQATIPTGSQKHVTISCSIFLTMEDVHSHQP